MDFSFKGFFYQVTIDPILSRLHDSVINNIEPFHRILDIACGTGSLAIAIAKKATHVTGIDLSEEIIDTARRSAIKRDSKNVRFEYRDASDLSCYKDKEFNVAVTSMAIHQFDTELAIKILSEMKRIASKLIILDYNYPMPKGFSRSFAFGIERLAGGDHYRNFRVYMKNGGIHYFLKQSGISISKEVIRGNGVFVIVVSN